MQLDEQGLRLAERWGGRPMTGTRSLRNLLTTGSSIRRVLGAALLTITALCAANAGALREEAVAAQDETKWSFLRRLILAIAAERQKKAAIWGPEHCQDTWHRNEPEFWRARTASCGRNIGPVWALP